VGRLFANLPPPSSDVIESIPLSRSDIFTSKSVSLMEKRGLVKFIEAVLKPTEDQSSSSSKGEGEDVASTSTESCSVEASKTFEELVKECKLTDKVKHLIRAAVQTLEDGFVSGQQGDNEDVFNLTFGQRCKTFLQSIGRFGNQTPYLWTLYGISMYA
jgi:RAB protein geranylgeranyltransferase component A